MNQCVCLRCGYKWWARYKYTQLGYREQESKRCAKCRSKYWNQPRVRKISEDWKNPNAPDYTSPLPFDSHNAGVVRSKAMICKRCGCTDQSLCERHQKRGFSLPHFRISGVCCYCMAPKYWASGYEKLPEVIAFSKISEDRKNPNAPDYIPPLPFNSRNAGVVRSKVKKPGEVRSKKISPRVKRTARRSKVKVRTK